MKDQDTHSVRKEGNPVRLHWALLVSLHLFPGLLFAFVYYWIAGAVLRNGLPVYIALMITIAVCLIPVELGTMWIARLRSSRKGIGAEKSYRNQGTLWEYTLLPLVLLVVCALLAWAASPLTRILENRLHVLVPNWASPQSLIAGLKTCTLPVRRISILLGVLFSGILAPVVEELYFRGFLLPRMERFGMSAPLLNAFLFGVYHVFSPWNIPAVFLAFIPIAYVVWIRKNVRIGIIAHCLLNIWGIVQLVLASRGGM